MKPAREWVSLGSGLSFKAFRRIEASYGFAWHYHPEFELTFIASGRGQRFIGDGISDYDGSDLVLIGPNLPHTWSAPPLENGGSHEAVVVQFSPALFGGGLEAIPEAEPLARLLEKSRRGLLFSPAATASQRSRLDRLPELKGLAAWLELVAILGALAGDQEAAWLSGEKPVAALDAGTGKLLDRVCQHINRHFQRSVAQREVAELAGLSPSAFSRFFRRAMGRSFVAYLEELRVSHACRLLASGEDPITRVAFASGYANLANFNRQFRRLKGKTPREYRRAFR